MVVARERISASALGCLGARCCTKTNAIPVSTGSAWRRWVNASSPPADAPTPTTGHDGSVFEAFVSEDGGRARFVFIEVDSAEVYPHYSWDVMTRFSAVGSAERDSWRLC